MMTAAGTLTHTLDQIAEWARLTIAPSLRYLVPPDDGAVDGIEPEWASPTVFQMFVPSAERLIAGEHQAPSIAVQLLGGLDDVRANRGLNIRLLLSIWAPGHYEKGAFVRDSEGWRDLINGLEAIVSCVEGADVIAGCAVDLTAGIRYGLFEAEKEIPDLYPYWLGRVDFTLRRAPHANKRFEDLL